MLLSSVLAWFSLFSSFILLVIFYTFRSQYPALLDRVSLRLLAFLSIVNMFHANSQLVELTNQPSISCGLSTITVYMLSLLSLFLITAVAFNLQLVYLHAKRNAARFERWYVLFSVLFAVTITGLSWALGGYDAKDDLLCGTHARDLSDPTQLLWALVSFDAWVILVLMYCGCVLIVIGIVVMHRIRVSKQKEKEDIAKALAAEKERRNSYPEGAGEEPTHVLRRESSVYRDEVSSSVTRILLVLIIPWLVYVWTIVADVDAVLSDGKPQQMWINVSQSAMASQGIFILIAFCLDANVRRVYKEMKGDLAEWYIDGTQEIVEMRQEGKREIPRSKRLVRWIVKNLLLSQKDLSKAAGEDTVFSPDVLPSFARRTTGDHSVVMLPTPTWQQQQQPLQPPQAAQPRISIEDPTGYTSNVVSLGRNRSERPPSQFFLGLTPPPPGRDPRKFSVIALGDTAPPASSASQAPDNTLEQQPPSSQPTTSTKNKMDWSTLTQL